ncbi:hypothetical protein FOCC_FOCC014282 [Frankliniella occidentalis]|nr:hypothetical protein FOCC_FOCC014282 [Frankliniella occidentalis]
MRSGHKFGPVCDEVLVDGAVAGAGRRRMSSVRGSLRRSRRPGSSPLGAGGGPGAGTSPASQGYQQGYPQGRPSLSSLGSFSSLGSDHPDSVHGVLDSLMGEGAKMQPKYALEDYIYEVQARGDMADHHHLQHLRPGQGDVPADAQGEDVYAELQRKEKDLILAAELGKALLEKNEELSRQNERIAEEFSQKLEIREIVSWTIVIKGQLWQALPLLAPPLLALAGAAHRLMWSGAAQFTVLSWSVKFNVTEGF